MLSQFSKPRTVESSILGWQRRLANIVTKKRNRLNHIDYQSFNENWLLIYDVFSVPIDKLNYGLAIEHLQALFKQQSPLAKEFDFVFILSNDLLFRWHKENLECARFDDSVALRSS
jgi:hypothetical protein